MATSELWVVVFFREGGVMETAVLYEEWQEAKAACRRADLDGLVTDCCRVYGMGVNQVSHRREDL